MVKSASSRLVIVLTVAVSGVLTACAGTIAASVTGTWYLLGTTPDRPTFFRPAGIAVGGRGNLFVADSGNGRILKLAPNGRVLADIGSPGPGPGQFGRMSSTDEPQSVAVDRAGTLYVADPGNTRIEKFTGGGHYLESWPVSGSGYTVAQLAVTTGPHGTVYVAIAARVTCGGVCPTYYIVQQRSTGGSILREWPSQRPPPVPTDPDVTPFGVITHITIAVGPAGTVYVGTSGPYICYKSCGDVFALDKWAPNGQLVKHLSGSSFRGPAIIPNSLAVDGSGHLFVANAGQGSGNIVELASDGHQVARYSGFGPHMGGMGPPAGVAVDSQGNIYVSEQSTNRLQKLNRTGMVLASWGAGSGVAGHFRLPEGLATDAVGNIYVNDFGNGRIQSLTPSGRVRFHFPVPHSGTAIAVGGRGNIYIGQRINQRFVISRFSPRGTLLTRWAIPHLAAYPSGLAVDRQGAIYILGTFFFPRSTDGAPDKPNGVYLLVLAPNGTTRMIARLATGLARSDIALDSRGNIYLADVEFGTVVKLGPAGDVQGKWPLAGFGRKDVWYRAGLALDTDGNVYVTDNAHDAVQEYSPTGVLLAQWRGTGAHPGQFHRPTGLAVTPSGTIYVSDSGNGRLQRFDRS